MHVIRARNVAEAYPLGLLHLLARGQRETTRAGDALVAPEPVATVYSHPCERVLFDAHRDANPFFHLMEGLWMLAGRRDAKFLDRYVRDFSSRFAEPGDDAIIHGAYGHRWRHHFGGEDNEIDQLSAIVDLLRRDPSTRHAVLAMWDPDYDLIYPEQDSFVDPPRLINATWRDRPCNTHVYFRVRDAKTDFGERDLSWGRSQITGTRSFLDMTVCCRSNDAVWGAYGANAVHMSMMQEYVAARVGVGVGTYTQISNNFHVYLDVLQRLQERGPIAEDQRYPNTTPLPLVEDPARFDEELHQLLGDIERDFRLDAPASNPMLDVAWRMHRAHSAWRKNRAAVAMMHIDDVVAPDWRRAGREWLLRRIRT